MKFTHWPVYRKLPTEVGTILIVCDPDGWEIGEITADGYKCKYNNNMGFNGLKEPKDLALSFAKGAARERS